MTFSPLRKSTGLMASVVWLGFLLPMVGQRVPAEEILTIRITQPIEAAESITVVPFGWVGAGSDPERLAQIIGDDLARTGQKE